MIFLKKAFHLLFLSPLTKTDHKYLNLTFFLLALYSVSHSIGSVLLFAPDPISPISYIDHNQPTFTWTLDPYASTYNLMIREKTTQEVVFSTSGLSSTEFSLPDTFQLEYGKTYQWLVQSVEESGGTSPWSHHLGFIPYDPDFVPVPHDPFAYIETSQPTFTWDPVSGADHYHLVVREKESQVTVFENTNIVGTSTDLPADLQLKFNQIYHWQVRAMDATGYASHWSPIRGFMPFDPTLVPTPLEPFAYISDLHPTFTWQPVDGISHYDLLLKVSESQEVIFEAQNLIETSYILPDDVQLEYGVVYQWQVRGGLSNGTNSHWSPNRGFMPYDDSRVPTPREPFAEIQILEPTFTWEAAANADYYEIELKDRDADLVVFTINHIIGTSLTFPQEAELKLDTVYNWKIRSYDSQGNPSLWSPIRGFIVEDTEWIDFQNSMPLGLLPSGQLPWNRQVQFEWEPIEGAAEYLVVIADTLDRRVVLSQKTTDPNFLLNHRSVRKHFRKNRAYHWSVTAYDENARPSLPSPSISFSLHLPFQLMKSCQEFNCGWKLSRLLRKSKKASLYERKQNHRMKKAKSSKKKAKHQARRKPVDPSRRF